MQLDPFLVVLDVGQELRTAVIHDLVDDDRRGQGDAVRRAAGDVGRRGRGQEVAGPAAGHRRPAQAVLLRLLHHGVHEHCPAGIVEEDLVLIERMQSRGGLVEHEESSRGERRRGQRP